MFLNNFEGEKHKNHLK